MRQVLKAKELNKNQETKYFEDTKNKITNKVMFWVGEKLNNFHFPWSKNKIKIEDDSYKKENEEYSDEINIKLKFHKQNIKDYLYFFIQKSKVSLEHGQNKNWKKKLNVILKEIKENWEI